MSRKGKRKVDLTKLRAILEQAIAAAEVLFGPKTGKEKEDWVVEQVNPRLDIPLVGEVGEEMIIRLLIRLLVDVLNSQGILANFARNAGYRV